MEIFTHLKDNFWTVVATLMMAGLVYFADVEKVFNAIKGANPIFVLLAVFCGVSNNLFWSFNWKEVFKIEEIEIGYLRSFQLYSGSQFLNLVTPLGQLGGEPIMAYLISEESDASFGNALATISSANVLIVVPITLSAIIGYLHLTSTGSVTAKINYLMAVTMLLASFAFLCIYLTWFRSEIARRILAKILKILDYIPYQDISDLHQKIDSFLDHAEKACSTLGKNPLSTIRPLLMASSAYGFTIVALYLVGLSLGIDFTIFEVMIFLPLVSVANFSPTPGGTGPVEAAMTGVAILLFGITVSTAVSMALLFRLTTYWIKILVGYISIASLNSDVVENYYEQQHDE